jgi:hypothetical protein
LSRSTPELVHHVSCPATDINKVRKAPAARQVKALLDGAFLGRKENVLAFGNPGSGKTHLLSALGQELIRTMDARSASSLKTGRHPLWPYLLSCWLAHCSYGVKAKPLRGGGVNFGIICE